jgi:hypothetical protein
MTLETDARIVANFAALPALGWEYGEYLGTFTSEHGQVRADLFRKGDQLVAHVSFPTGLTGSRATDRYVEDLHDYAREHGFEKRPQLIYS